MNKKIIFATLILLAGCGKKTESVSVNSSSSEAQETSNEQENSASIEVTKDNFMTFPVSDESDFAGSEVEGGFLIGSYNGNDKVVVVPEKIDGYTVIGIDTYSFSNTECEAIVLPDTVEYINRGSFNDSTFKYIYLGKNLKSVGELAFSNCGSLLEINFPDGIEKLDPLCINSCDLLKDVYIPESATDIPDKIAIIDMTPNIVIHTPSGSVAEQMAKDAGLPVVND